MSEFRKSSSGAREEEEGINSKCFAKALLSVSGTPPVFICCP